ncbi:hypothetical protein AVEN_212510-1 [Araneus ventricosus]|uniref:Uncharacterized protein n=1 Tax=Araneus ventricosus TaxID=182803 RepID=A0A4Y2KBQ4_ARAVE|nr:hypothetical protein AVEN_212510-1 [Araneus ventricosus]
MSKGNNFVDNLSKSLSPSFTMPMPADTSTVADAGAKTTKGPGTGSQPRVIPNVEDIVKKVNNLNLDKELSEFLVSSLQDLSTGLFWYPGWVGSVSPFDRETLTTFSRPKEGV